MRMCDRITAARVRLTPKMSKVALAAKMGVTKQAVQAWEDPGEKGRRPDSNKLPKLARVLKVPIAWLLEGDGAPPPPDVLEAAIESLSASQRALVSAIVQTMLRAPEEAA